MDSSRIVVVGGGYAGLFAALRVAGRTRGRAQVTLVSASPGFVERIRLHEVAAGRALPDRSLAELTRGTEIAIEHMPVERIDPERRLVVGPRSLPFDVAVLATGSTIEPSVPGFEHAHTLADVAAAQALGRRVDAIADGGRLVVVGGGLTAIELATELAEKHPRLRVTLASSGVIGAGLSERARAYLASVFDLLRIERLEGVRIDSLAADAVRLVDGRSLPADAIAWCAGFRPSGLARRSGLAVSSAGQLLVDGTLRSISHPHVLGAGDAVAFADEAGGFIRMGCASAMPMGAHAADVIGDLVRGRAPRPYGFGFFVQCVSLGRRRGLVQHVDAFDRPQRWFWRGRTGALLKEAVCRFTVAALHAERLHPGAYRWPRKGTPLVTHPLLPVREVA